MNSKNILVLTYWDFDSALIQTYTLPYVEQIKKQLNPSDKIYLLTLSNKDAVKSSYSLKIIEDLESRNILVINFRYNKFGWLMAAKLFLIILYLVVFTFIKKINSFHAWCTPGGAIGYLLSVLTGRPLVLDSFEPHAETMVEGHTWRANSIPFKLLFKLEKLQLKKAKEVICASEGMIEHSKNIYGITKSRYFIKPACVDLDLFNYVNYENNVNTEFQLKTNTCVYAGKFGSIYLEQEVFDFFKAAYDYWDGDFSVLLLTNHTDEEIKNYCAKSSFPFTAIIKKFVSHRDVPRYMSMGNFGICPVKPIPSKRFCSPIKNGEYWAMGLPIVITQNISSDSELIDKNNIGYVLKKLDREEYTNAVKKIDELLHQQNMKDKIRAIAQQERNFEKAELIYKTIYA